MLGEGDKTEVRGWEEKTGKDKMKFAFGGCKIGELAKKYIPYMALFVFTKKNMSRTLPHKSLQCLVVFALRSALACRHNAATKHRNPWLGSSGGVTLA